MYALSMVEFSPDDVNDTGFGGGKLTSYTNEYEDTRPGALEIMPHNLIHVFIGGKMADNCKASEDPIFWFHHAQTDRLWESWSSNNRRQHLSDKEWLEQTFAFYNHHGIEEIKKVKDVLNPERQLNYRYRSLVPVPPQKKNHGVCKDCILIAELVSADAKGVIKRGQDSITLTFTPHSEVLLDNICESPLKMSNAIFTLLLEIKSINHELFFDVYLNDANDIDPKNDKNYVRPIAVLGCTTIRNSNERVVIQHDVTDLYKIILNPYLSNLKGHKVNVTFEAVDCSDKNSDFWLNLSGVKLFYGNARHKNVKNVKEQKIERKKCYYVIWGLALICAFILICGIKSLIGLCYSRYSRTRYERI